MYAKDPKGKQKKHTNDSVDINHNYTPDLYLHSLQKGLFRADISLDIFPPEDNLVVQIHNYTLDIFRMTDGKNKDGKSESTLKQCGTINLPIYIDTNTLRFALNSENKLHMECFMKSYLTKINKNSNDNADFVLQSPPLLYKTKISNTNVSCNLFRARANTH